METFASTFRDAGSFFSEEQARQIARNDQQVMLQGELDGVPVSVLGRAVTDFSGNPLGVLEIAMDRSIYESYIAGFRAALISISVIAVIVGTLVAYVISQSVLTALNQVRSVTENLAVGDGDLTVRLPEQGSDELACLSNNINVFLAKTEGIITNVRASTEGVASSSEQLSSSSNEMSVGMNMQAQAITQISTAVSEMAETVNVVARNMSEVLGSSQNALQVARAGGDTVGQSVQEMTTIASEVDRTAHSARELEEKSRRVEEVIQVINDIADQTNLLALNAAIEAARAGDAGRGFAVVADEVRKLAERSTQSTGEIIGIVKTIQTGVNTVTNALAKVNEKVQNGAQLSEQTSGAFASILREMDALMHLIEDNVAAIEEMSKTTDHINDDIQSISSASEETAKASEEVSFAAGDLARLAAEVRQHISAFRTGSSSEEANDIKRIALYDNSRK
ncbi:chemotaxis sensory transducer [Desulfurispirillum indicum S5]|uniref:Chemotaxis sensory transducer n=1 Tax=Desulfurispirillum indicum (strain ATCC BAA-1389 / DSM 22839 / S5) TaxID=653733 RepID=E6W134_DESIS|nr:methyl-accepting chemotaxis protein [Desulfurispirillum indicum]ADU65366.1 chemotaxis sensory transducer [Desulfurispirillum indicum S5]